MLSFDMRRFLVLFPLLARRGTFLPPFRTPRGVATRSLAVHPPLVPIYPFPSTLLLVFPHSVHRVPRTTLWPSAARAYRGGQMLSFVSRRAVGGGLGGLRTAYPALISSAGSRHRGERDRGRLLAIRSDLRCPRGQGRALALRVVGAPLTED